VGLYVCVCKNEVFSKDARELNYRKQRRRDFLLIEFCMSSRWLTGGLALVTHALAAADAAAATCF
jgi:hypothetical protein